MILFNTTYCVTPQIEKEWLAWVKHKHLPNIKDTNLPLDAKLLRLLTEIDNGGITFTVQCIFSDMSDYENFVTNHAPTLDTKHHERFEGQYVSFQTLLEYL